MSAYKYVDFIDSIIILYSKRDIFLNSFKSFIMFNTWNMSNLYQLELVGLLKVKCGNCIRYTRDQKLSHCNADMCRLVWIIHSFLFLISRTKCKIANGNFILCDFILLQFIITWWSLSSLYSTIVEWKGNN
jgi:hypothetical protein